MFKNVLVGVDGRPAGRDAIALARQLCDAEAKLTLAFARTGDIAGDIVESQQMLERERAATDSDAGLLSVVSFSPGRALHEQAERQSADLIVVGSCRHGIFGRAMAGDDTRAALNGAPCAVAIAAHGYAEHNPAISQVGVAYNGSPESVVALAAARRLAASTDAKLHALEVVSPVSFGGMVVPVGDFIEEMVKEAGVRMAALADIDGRAVYGLAGEELARFGDELDLLIVGSRGYGPLQRMLSSSTSRYLERHARCSLLVLPRGDVADTAGAEEQSSERHAAAGV